MKFLKKAIDVFLDGSFLLAIASVCLCYETYLLLGENVKSPGVFPLVFFSTLFIYNYRLIGAENTGAIPKYFLKLFVLLIVFGMMASCVFVRPSILLFLFPFGILSLIYNVPIVHRAENIIRLREMPYLKIFLISLIWAVVTVMVPAKDLGIDIFSHEIGIVFLRRVLFIFALALPFDIRDAQKDSLRHLKTLPVILGEKKSKLFALGALGIYCAMDIIHYFHITHVPQLGIAFLVSALVLGLLVIISSPSRSKYYFQVLLDGTLILQFLFVYIAIKI